jgi:hypothetical protein
MHDAAAMNVTRKDGLAEPCVAMRGEKNALVQFAHQPVDL